MSCDASTRAPAAPSADGAPRRPAMARPERPPPPRDLVSRRRRPAAPAAVGDQAARDAETRPQRPGAVHDRRRTARCRERPSAKSASSPADALDRRPGDGIDAEEALGEATAELGIGIGTHDDAAAVLREADRHGLGAVVAGERHVMREQESARRARENLDRQLELVAVRRRAAQRPRSSHSACL